MAKEQRAKDEKPWSTMGLFDLRHAIEQGETIEQAASVLRRSGGEVLRAYSKSERRYGVRP
jgi:hypothetical protein